MRVIHKKRLMMNDTDIPRDAIILHVGEQDNGLTVWYSIDEDRVAGHGMRYLQVVGTGSKEPAFPWVHVGSAVVNAYVWHVYDHSESAS